MKDTDYELILQGSYTFRIIGDLGVLLPIPIMQEATDKQRIWYLHNMIHTMNAIKDNPQPQMLAVGGQIAVNLMKLGLARVEIFDYNPTRPMQDALREMVDDLTGFYPKDLHYKQINGAYWHSKGGLDTEIGNYMNSLREQDTGDILINGRDRHWWEEIFPDWRDMSERYKIAHESYLPKQEKQTYSKSE